MCIFTYTINTPQKKFGPFMYKSDWKVAQKEKVIMFWNVHPHF